MTIDVDGQAGGSETVRVASMSDLKVVMCARARAVPEPDAAGAAEKAASAAARKKANRGRRPLEAETHTYEVDRLLARQVYNHKDWCAPPQPRGPRGPAPDPAAAERTVQPAPHNSRESHESCAPQLPRAMDRVGP